MPKISYLVSTYDAGSYLDRHLRDLLEYQTDPEFEVIIVNPNSPGTDEAIAHKWCLLDDRVRYIYHHEREPYGQSWLRAYKVAKANYVSNSNTDDLHVNVFTNKFFNYALNSDDSIAFWYSGWIVQNELGEVHHESLKPTFNRDRFKYQCEAGPQVMWRADAEFRSRLNWDLMWERAGQHTSAFDFWMWLMFLSLGYNGYSIPEILTIYTQRPDSIENRRPRQNTYESLASISEFFPESVPKEWPEFRDFNNLPDKEKWIKEHL